MKRTKVEVTLSYIVMAATCCLPGFVLQPTVMSAQQSSLSPGAAYTVDDILDLHAVRASALSPDGQLLVATTGSLRNRLGVDHYRNGDPTYVSPTHSQAWVIETATGRTRPLLDGTHRIGEMEWSPDNEHLAVVLYEDEIWNLYLWNRSSGELQTVALPTEQILAGQGGGGLNWTPDGGTLIIPTRSADWEAETYSIFEGLTEGPIVHLRSEDPFLEWEELRRQSMYQSLLAFDMSTGEIEEILPVSAMNSYGMIGEGGRLRLVEDITEETSYERIFGRTSQIKIVSTETGEARVLVESTEEVNPRWSEDGTAYAFTRRGDIFFAHIDDEEPRRLTGSEAKEEGEEEEDEEDEERIRFGISSLSPSGSRLIATTDEGFWLIDTDSGEQALFLETPETEEREDSYQIQAWSPDEEEIYFRYQAGTRWERGFLRYDFTAATLDTLVMDGRLYSGLQLSDDGSTVIFTAAEGNHPTDLYATDPDFQDVHRLTNVNPGLERKGLSETELFDYLDTDGDKLYGVLYYPAGYRPGNAYPTVFLVYEEYFDNSFNSTISYLTSNGYVVVRPSVDLEVGYPGEAWVKGVTAAANELIRRGITDAEAMGVHGTSYGGYATNLLVTHTDRFKAAINISGKVELISFYADSPRLGVRNIHAAERSQDRIGATLWEAPQKYIEHTALFFADRVETPLLLMTGDQDHNVPARSTWPMYYALRRLGKTVEWVNYINGGHGMPTTTVEEVRHYHETILEWYDRYLKGEGDKAATSEDGSEN